MLLGGGVLPTGRRGTGRSQGEKALRRYAIAVGFLRSPGRARAVMRAMNCRARWPCDSLLADDDNSQLSARDEQVEQSSGEGPNQPGKPAVNAVEQGHGTERDADRDQVEGPNERPVLVAIGFTGPGVAEANSPSSRSTT